MSRPAILIYYHVSWSKYSIHCWGHIDDVDCMVLLPTPHVLVLEGEKFNTTIQRWLLTVAWMKHARADSRLTAEWTPVEFCYPKFQPLTGFDLETTKPVPYRPFRWATLWGRNAEIMCKYSFSQDGALNTQWLWGYGRCHGSLGLSWITRNESFMVYSRHASRNFFNPQLSKNFGDSQEEGLWSVIIFVSLTYAFIHFV
jgi:hypothetical protein